MKKLIALLLALPFLVGAVLIAVTAPPPPMSQLVEWDRDFTKQWIRCYEYRRSAEATECTITLVRDTTENSALTVTYDTQAPSGSEVIATAGGSCSGATDYVSVSGGTIVFGTSDLTKTATLTVCDNDPGEEVHEAFEVTITDAGIATIGDANSDGNTATDALVRIVDDYRQGDNGVFYTSSEPGCDGSDSNIVFCDDFEDGSWAETDENDSSSTGSNDGWELTEFAPDPPDWPDGTVDSGTSGGWARCGGLGVAGTDCQAWSGEQSCNPVGQGSAMLGTHTWVDAQGLTDFYFRWYVFWPSDYDASHQKLHIMQDGVGPNWQMIQMRYNFGSDAPGWEALDGYTDDEFESGFTVAKGSWTFHEVRYVLGTAGMSDGSVTYWADDCGANGLGCTGTPTLRHTESNIKMRNNASELVKQIWFENFSSVSPSSCGIESYDQLVVSKTGPIGFMVNQ